MLKLLVVYASVRANRACLPVGHWFLEQAKAHGKFEVQLADLKEINLPMYDEPRHPRLRQYEYAHTKAWSAIVEPADAYVFVTPEYNHGSPPALVNALDYVCTEWADKPAGFVSYGGIAAGARSVQMTKQILAALRVVPIFEAVQIPFVTNQLKDGAFQNTDKNDAAAKTMLDELMLKAEALKALRA